MFKRYVQRFASGLMRPEACYREPFSQYSECQGSVPSLRKFQPTCRLSLTALQRKRDWWTSLYSYRELNSIWWYLDIFIITDSQEINQPGLLLKILSTMWPIYWQSQANKNPVGDWSPTCLAKYIPAYLHTICPCTH